MGLVNLNMIIQVLEIGVEVAGGEDCSKGLIKGYGTALYNQLDFNIK